MQKKRRIITENTMKSTESLWGHADICLFTRARVDYVGHTRH